MKKTATISMMLLITLLISVTSFAQDEKPKVKYPDVKRWKDAMNNFKKWDAKNSTPENAILFVGSSSIVNWQTAKAFPEFPVINRGFGGSVMADSVYYAETVILKYKPQIVVVYAGDNDVAGNIPPEYIAKDFEKLANIIHKALPKTHIIVLPVKPSPSRWHFWGKMKETNALYAKYAQTKKYITFLDTAATLLDKDGNADKSLFVKDMLHMNDKGYAKWNAVTRPLLKKLYKK